MNLPSISEIISRLSEEGYDVDAVSGNIQAYGLQYQRAEAYKGLAKFLKVCREDAAFTNLFLIHLQKEFEKESDRETMYAENNFERLPDWLQEKLKSKVAE